MDGEDRGTIQVVHSQRGERDRITDALRSRFSVTAVQFWRELGPLERSAARQSSAILIEAAQAPHGLSLWPPSECLPDIPIIRLLETVALRDLSQVVLAHPGLPGGVGSFPLESIADVVEGILEPKRDSPSDAGG